MEPKQPNALQSSSNRKAENTQRTRRHARLIFNPLDKINQKKYPQLMIAPEDINKIDIVKPNVEAIEIFNGMTEEVVEAVPGVVLVVNMKKDENTIKNNMDIHNVLKDNIYLSDHYKTVVDDVGNRNVGQVSYSSSSASFSTNENFHNNKDDRSNILANIIDDPTIDNLGNEVKKKVVPVGTRVMLVGDELPDVEQSVDVPRTSHTSSVYNELLKSIMKTTNVVNKNCNIIPKGGGDDGSTIVDSHDDNDQSQSQLQSQHNHNHNAVLKLGPKARKRFLILKYSLPKQQQQHMKLTRHLKVEIIRECKSIVDLDCWSDEENHLFDLPDDDDVKEEEEEIGSEGKNKILRLSRAQYNNPLIDESRHRGRAQYQDRSSPSPTTTAASIASLSLKPSDIVQDDHDELIRNAVAILYRYKRAQLKKAQSKNKSTTLQKLRVISTFMLRLIKRKRQQRLHIYQKLCMMKIVCYLRKYRIRRFVRVVLEAGKKSRAERLVNEEKDLEEFRLRIARRRMKEDRSIKHWLYKKKKEKVMMTAIDGYDDGIDDSDGSRRDLQVDVYNTYDYDLLMNNNIVNSNMSDDQSVTKIIDTRLMTEPLSMNKSMLLSSSPPRLINNSSIQSSPPSSFIASSPRYNNSNDRRMKKMMNVNTVKQMEFEYNRPDLAPFSTMINQKMENSLLYKYKRIGMNAIDMKDWDQFASISDTYTDDLKVNKSSAFKVLEKLCGITKEQVETAKLIVNESSKVRAEQRNSLVFL